MPAEGGILLNKKAQQEHHNGNPGDKGDAQEGGGGQSRNNGVLDRGRMPLVRDHTDALADVHKGKGGHEGGDFEVDVAQADEQTAEHAHTYRNNHAEETQIVRKFTVEDKAGKQGARHAHASVNGQINAAQHNDKGQSQGHYQGQGHLVENIHNILGGEEAGPTDNEKDNHKTGQHDQRCQLHHFCAAVFTLDAFGELFRDGRRRI